MRGIAFIGGETPEPGLGAALAKQGDLIVAADSGLLAAVAAGIRPDWIIGDMDSLDEAGRLDLLDSYPAERVRRFPRDKDFTDTELALSLLWEQGCDETWLVGGGGGRLDHILGIRSLFERERSPDRWVTAAEDIRLVEDRFTVSLKAGSIFSVFPLGAGPWDAESQGLHWSLAGLPWNRGFIGLSNVADEGAVSIRVRAGRFMVILPLPEGNLHSFAVRRRFPAGGMI
jgi:thiamine pyrophosphokinase